MEVLGWETGIGRSTVFLPSPRRISSGLRESTGVKYALPSPLGFEPGENDPLPGLPGEPLPEPPQRTHHRDLD
jgi:hypothetical protein